MQTRACPFSHLDSLKPQNRQKGNNALIQFHSDKGILRSSKADREYKDRVYFSDLQRCACITDNYKENLVKEYHSEAVIHSQTTEIANALYHANIKLHPDKNTNDTLNFTKGSAAFQVFLGTEVNLSRIYLAKDLGLSIQEVTIRDTSKGMIESQWKFIPDT